MHQHTSDQCSTHPQHGRTQGTPGEGKDREDPPRGHHRVHYVPHQQGGAEVHHHALLLTHQPSAAEDFGRECQVLDMYSQDEMQGNECNNL